MLRFLVLLPSFVCILAGCGLLLDLDPPDDAGLVQDAALDGAAGLDAGPDGALPDAAVVDASTDGGVGNPFERCEPLPAPGPTVKRVGPGEAEDLPAILAEVDPGTAVVLTAGTYDLGETLRIGAPDVLLRSATGDPGSVVLDGSDVEGPTIEVAASGVAVAELTVRGSQEDAIRVHGRAAGDVEGVRIYRVRFLDWGGSAVRVQSYLESILVEDDPPPTGLDYHADRGLVACSSFFLTEAHRAHETCDGDVHAVFATGARGWRIQDNVFESVYCTANLVTAVQLSHRSAQTIVDRNRFRDCAICLRLGWDTGRYDFAIPDIPVREPPERSEVCTDVDADHYGGIVRNNFISAGAGVAPEFDSGIALWQACGARVLHNTVVTAEPPYSSIEWRYPNTRVALLNNLVSHNLRQRSEAVAAPNAGNVTDADPALFLDPPRGDLHLVPGADVPVGVPLTEAPLRDLAPTDIDREPRSLEMPAPGADEPTG